MLRTLGTVIPVEDPNAMVHTDIGVDFNHGLALPGFSRFTSSRFILYCIVVDGIILQPLIVFPSTLGFLCSLHVK